MEASTPKWMLLNRSLFNCPYKNASPAAQTGEAFFSAFYSIASVSITNFTLPSIALSFPLNVS